VKPLHVALILAVSPFAVIGFGWAAYLLVRGAAVVLLIAEAVLEMV